MLYVWIYLGLVVYLTIGRIVGQKQRDRYAQHPDFGNKLNPDSLFQDGWVYTPLAVVWPLIILTWLVNWLAGFTYEYLKKTYTIILKLINN